MPVLALTLSWHAVPHLGLLECLCSVRDNGVIVCLVRSLSVLTMCPVCIA